MLLAPRDPRSQAVPLARSVVVFAVIAAGFVTARALPGVPAAAWLAAACGGCAIAGLIRGRGCRVVLALACAAFGGGWFAVRIHEAPARALDLLAPLDRPSVVVTLEGVAVGSARALPVERDPLHPMGHLLDPGVRFNFAVETARAGAEVVPVRGRVRVLAPREGAGVRAGDRLRVTGEFRPVAPPMNPGEADRRLWAAQAGEAGTVRVPSADLIEPLPRGRAGLEALHATVLTWRESLSARAQHALLGDRGDDGRAGAESRALLAALLLGEEEPALRDVRSAFTRLGLAHVLAISGFHLTVMAAVVLVALRLTGDRGWVEPALVAALVGLYLFILPVQAPIWRSGLMTLGLLAADAIGRRYDRLAMLGWIAVAMLIWRPMDLWSMGFQLSFGMVGLLMWMGQTTYRRVYGVVYAGPYPASPRSVGGWLIEQGRMYLSSSLLCWAVAMPLVAYHTGLVSIAGVIASVVLLPPMLLLLAAGYAALAAGLLFPPVAELSAGALEAVSRWTIWLVEWMDAAPGASVYLPALSAAWACAATGVLLYWFARGHARDRAGWIAGSCAAAWLAGEVWLGPRLPAGVALRIDTLAVGDGTCHLIRGRGAAVLWDCGSLTPGVGRRVVPRAVRALGAWHVPTVVISHPNLDHFNGLLDAAGAGGLGVQRVLVSDCFLEQATEQPAGAEAFLLAGLAARGIDVGVLRLGEEIALGGGTLKVLSPPPAVEREWPNDNDRSLVAEITVPVAGGAVRRAIMTGDIQDRAIDFLSREHPRLRVDIAEAPHHGSARDASIKFVAALNPSVVLQSTGPERAGDARWDAVRRFRDWYTTALDGASWAEVRSDGSIRSGGLWRR